MILRLKQCIMCASSFHRKKYGLAECATTQLDLFDHSVCDHTVTARSFCTHHAPKARCMMNDRQNRGLAIAANPTITRKENIWVIPSQSSSKRYTVNLDAQTCTCPDFEDNRQTCKHIYAAEFALQRESGIQLPAPEKVAKRTYKQAWHEYNLAQVNEKAHLQTLLYELCNNVEDLPRKNLRAGRNRLPMGEMIFAVVFKIYSMVSGRRFISDLMEAQRRGLISKTPHFNSIFNYLELEEMTAVLRQLIVTSSLPLKAVETDFAVDSSGFSTGVYKKWVDAKWPSAELKRHPGFKPLPINSRDWLKCHLMCGVRTNIVTSVEITQAFGADGPQFRPLVESTSRNFTIRSVAADKAYSSTNNLQLVTLKGGEPYIAFKAGSKGDGKCAVWNRVYHYYAMNREEFMRHYHLRSNVETTFSMVKRKFGDKVRSKTTTAQTNEVLCKVLCHNICCLIQSMYELGIEVNFAPE